MVFSPIPVANLAQILAAEAVARQMRPYAPVAATTGGETWFRGAGAFVCQDAATWSRVWDQHVQNEALGNVGAIGNLNPAPAVDFDKNVLVALFNGPSNGIVGYRPQGGYLLGRQAVLRMVPLLNGSSTTSVALPSPWAFLVLPRTKAAVSIQLPGDAGWRTVAQVKPSL